MDRINSCFLLQRAREHLELGPFPGFLFRLTQRVLQCVQVKVKVLHGLFNYLARDPATKYQAQTKCMAGDTG